MQKTICKYPINEMKIKFKFFCIYLTIMKINVTLLLTFLERKDILDKAIFI